jgi:hypothetical protein
MPYILRLNTMRSLSTTDMQQLAIEFNALRQELDEVRANYNAVLAKLDADGGVTDINYVSTLGVAASTVTALATAPRRFTPT